MAIFRKERKKILKVCGFSTSNKGKNAELFFLIGNHEFPPHMLNYAHSMWHVVNRICSFDWRICAHCFLSLCSSQVDNAKVLHYVGAGVAFPTSMLFVCLQSALTYRLAKTQGEYNLGHLRLFMTLLAFVALVLSILYTIAHSHVIILYICIRVVNQFRLLLS